MSKGDYYKDYINGDYEKDDVHSGYYEKLNRIAPTSYSDTRIYKQDPKKFVVSESMIYQDDNEYAEIDKQVQKIAEDKINTFKELDEVVDIEIKHHGTNRTVVNTTNYENLLLQRQVIELKKRLEDLTKTAEKLISKIDVVRPQMAQFMDEAKETADLVYYGDNFTQELKDMGTSVVEARYTLEKKPQNFAPNNNPNSVKIYVNRQKERTAEQIMRDKVMQIMKEEVKEAK